MRPNIHTIHASYGFADTLVKGIMERVNGDPIALSRTRIFVPNRRSVGIIKDAFLKNNDHAVILPKIMPIGDGWDEGLDLAINYEFDKNNQHTPPPVPALRKYWIIMRLIDKLSQFSPYYAQIGPADKWNLARSMGKILDEMTIEMINLADLANLQLPKQHAEHWQEIQQFLAIIGGHWQDILKNEGYIDSEEDRNNRILALGEYFKANPPADLLIIAGSTGTRPAVQSLMQVIAHCPNGHIVLPGLNPHLTAEECEYLAQKHSEYADFHPQRQMINLLTRLNVTIYDVEQWYQTTPISPQINQRMILLNELFRPPEFVHQWHDNPHNQSAIRGGFDGLEYIETNNEHSEARLVADICAHFAPNPALTIMVIVHNYQMARMIRHACQQRGVTIIPNIGMEMIHTNHARFLLQIHQFLDRPNALNFLSILKNPLYHRHVSAREAIDYIDQWAARDHISPNILANIAQFLHKQPQNDVVLTGLAIIDEFRNILSEKNNAIYNENLVEKCRFIHETALNITNNQIFYGFIGEKLGQFWQEFMGNCHENQPMTWFELGQLIRQIMQTIIIYPEPMRDGQIIMLTPIESRNQKCDITIITGAEEGVFPANLGHDPWFSRKMRQDLGLKSHEFAIAQSAHDFATNLLSPLVFLTRALNRNGNPTNVSRWLERLLALGVIHHIPLGQTAKYWHKNNQIKPEFLHISPYTTPPAPAIAQNHRPRQISLSDYELYSQNPFGYCAKRVFRLQKLNPYKISGDNQLRGSLIHQITQKFCEQYRHSPLSAGELMENIIQKVMQDYQDIPIVQAFWLPNIRANQQWFITQIHQILPDEIYNEISGSWRIKDDFTLYARADRLDIRGENAVVIDYKTYQPPSKTKRMAGLAPQIPLEAVMYEMGGFPAINPNHRRRAVDGEYWVWGKNPKSSEISPYINDKNLDFAGIMALCSQMVSEFATQMTNPEDMSFPAQANIYFNEYAHLAREAEWNLLEEDESEE